MFDIGFTLNDLKRAAWTALFAAAAVLGTGVTDWKVIAAAAFAAALSAIKNAVLADGSAWKG